jgi:hypothetical protein
MRLEERSESARGRRLQLVVSRDFSLYGKNTARFI